MANEYVTKASLKATLQLTNETYADADIAVALEAASRSVDEVCGRRFYSDPDANQVRYYSPQGQLLIWIDDLQQLTSLQADQNADGTFEETWTLNRDFLLEPLNPEFVDGVKLTPWSVVRRHPLGTHLFPPYPRSLKVTGMFGWPVVPAAVVEATGILATKLLRRAREAPFGIVTMGIDQAAAMRVARSDPDVMVLLDPYVKRSYVI